MCKPQKETTMVVVVFLMKNHVCGHFKMGIEMLAHIPSWSLGSYSLITGELSSAKLCAYTCLSQVHYCIEI